jgi:hypothetical protein
MGLSDECCNWHLVDGRVVVEGATLAEGSTVTVLLREDDEAFDLTPEEEAKLLESIVEIERGEFVSGEKSIRSTLARVPRGFGPRRVSRGALRAW